MFPEAGNRVDKEPLTSSDYMIRDVSKSDTLNPLNSLNRTELRVSWAGTGKKNSPESEQKYNVRLCYVFIYFRHRLFQFQKGKEKSTKKETIKK